MIYLVDRLQKSGNSPKISQQEQTELKKYGYT